jgi:hypothetical protein
MSQWNHDKNYYSDRDLFAEYSNITQMYTSQPRYKVKPRYKDWYYTRLGEEGQSLKDTLMSYAFLGVTEFYETSMCLFYFTFQMHILFHKCQDAVTLQYNAACDPAKDECNDKEFINKPQEKDDPHELLAAKLMDIHPDAYTIISKYARQDI